MDSDAVFIVTECHEMTDDLLKKASQLMKKPVIFDVRNCFSLEEARQFSLEYHSIGRPTVYPEK
jgi:UDPglucose 6-dehydrogenase